MAMMFVEVHLDNNPREWGEDVSPNTTTEACLCLAEMLEDYISERWPDANTFVGVGSQSEPDDLWGPMPNEATPPPYAAVYVSFTGDDEYSDEDGNDEDDVETYILDYISDNWEDALAVTIHTP